MNTTSQSEKRWAYLGRRSPALRRRWLAARRERNTKSRGRSGTRYFFSGATLLTCRACGTAGRTSGAAGRGAGGGLADRGRSRITKARFKPVMGKRAVDFLHNLQFHTSHILLLPAIIRMEKVSRSRVELTICASCLSSKTFICSSNCCVMASALSCKVIALYAWCLSFDRSAEDFGGMLTDCAG